MKKVAVEICSNKEKCAFYARVQQNIKPSDWFVRNRAGGRLS